jgi:Zn-dependent protease with chaperone function
MHAVPFFTVSAMQQPLTEISGNTSNPWSIGSGTPYPGPTKEDLVREFKKLDNDNPTGFTRLSKAIILPAIQKSWIGFKQLPSIVYTGTQNAWAGVKQLPSIVYTGTQNAWAGVKQIQEIISQTPNFITQKAQTLLSHYSYAKKDQPVISTPFSKALGIMLIKKITAMQIDNPNLVAMIILSIFSTPKDLHIIIKSGKKLCLLTSSAVICSGKKMYQTYQNTKKIILSIITKSAPFLGSFPISDKNAPLLFSMIERAAKNKKMPIPPLILVYKGTCSSHLASHLSPPHVVGDLHCNALAWGFAPDCAFIMIGKDLIENPLLSPIQLEAIISHELRHVTQRVLITMNILNVLSYALARVLFSQTSRLKTRFNDFIRLHNMENIYNSLTTKATSISEKLTPEISQLIDLLVMYLFSQMYIQRILQAICFKGLELDADISTIGTYGDNLADGLEKIYLITYGKRRLIADLLNNHPSFQTRNKIIRALAPKRTSPKK